MKKATKDGIVHTIRIEPINSIRVHGDKTVFPTQYKFELEILCSDGKPSIANQDPQEWIFSVFNYKLITKAENNNPEFVEFCNNLFPSPDPILFVKELDSEYILTMLFQIIEHIIDNNCKLINIGYYD